MKIKMAAVGDITYGDHPMCVGFGAYSHFKDKQPNYPLEHVGNYLNECDLVFANLECAHSIAGLKKKDYDSIQMRGKPKDIDGIKEAGIQIVSFATNHSMQHGEKPFLETLELLDQKQIKYCGVSLENHLKVTPVILEKNDIKITFLGYNLRPRQYFNKPPLYTEGIEENIIEDVRKINKESDVVIVSLHWGDEFINRPSPKEILLARKIIDSGASLIIGHHPHVLKGIEKYNHGYIAYSLGNFVCDMIWDNRLRESLILDCTISKKGMEKIELIPVWINNNYQPEITNGKVAKKITDDMYKMSKKLENYKNVNLEQDTEKYENEADNFQMLYRSKAHKYFLKNIIRFPFFILLQQIKTYLVNRIDERTSLKNKLTNR